MIRISATQSGACTAPVSSPGGQTPHKRCIGFLLGALMLLYGGTASACLATCVGLIIEQDVDSNGVMSVVNGTRVKVGWVVLQNDEKLLKSTDLIQLVRASDNVVVSSAKRGKGNSGTVSLKVKSSENDNEELYVRYLAKKDGSFPAATPDLGDPQRVRLVSIPGADLNDLTIRLNALENLMQMIEDLTTRLSALENVPQMTYAIGDVGPAGGWVFYVTEGGLHGLEAAPADLASAEWGCQGDDLNGADGTAIGAGAQNTGDILSGCMSPGIAARLASNYWLNGYNDWFLPSLDELMQISINQSVVEGLDLEVGYWSSSECTDCVAGLAAKVLVVGTGFGANVVKGASLLARAVRAF